MVVPVDAHAQSRLVEARQVSPTTRHLGDELRFGAVAARLRRGTRYFRIQGGLVRID